MTTDNISLTASTDGVAVGRDNLGFINTGNITLIIEGMGDLPMRYDGNVRNFLEYYLGAPDRPAPFGGRAKDLAALDHWLTDSHASPYLLLSAPAGPTCRARRFNTTMKQRAGLSGECT